MSAVASEPSARRRVSRIAIAVAAIFLLFIANTLLASAVAAYTTTGCKWPNGPGVTYRFNMGSGTNQTQAQDALNVWSAGTDVNLSHSYSSNFSITSANDGNSGYDGRTTWWCGFGVTTSAQSWVNTYYTASFPANKIEAVYSHEIGHGLGLSHSSAGNIMYTCPACTYNNYSGRYTPQTDDRAGMNALY